MIHHLFFSVVICVIVISQLSVSVNAQDCRAFSYAIPAVNAVNASFSLSSNNKINSFQEVVDTVQKMYLSLIKEDRDFNSRMYVSFSNGDMIAVANCRMSINNNFTSTNVFDNVIRTSCIKSQTVYIAAIVSSTVYSDSLVHAYNIDATGNVATTQASQIFTSSQTYTSTLFSKSSSILSNSCNWNNDNSSYICKGMNYVIAADYYSTIEPCIDQCLTTSHAVKIVDQLMYLKSTILSYNNIQSLSQIYPLVSLLIQYANAFDKAYTFIVVGFANDDFYGLRKCYMSDYPEHEACLAAGPSQKYVFQMRNSRIWNDSKRHSYVITDAAAGVIASLNHAETSDYITTQKTWYVQAANNPTKQPIWSDPYAFYYGYGRTYGAAMYNAGNVMSGVLGADHAGYVPCYETALRNNYAVTVANNAVAASFDNTDLVTIATTVTAVNKVLSKLYQLYSVSDKDDSISIMITQTNGDFYLIQDCYHYSQGNNSLCSLSRSNRWIAHISNNAVLGDKNLHFRYITILSSTSVSMSDKDIVASVTFDALQHPHYMQALIYGFGWSSYSSAQLGPSGNVYYARLVSASNVQTISAVIASFTYTYQLNTKYDINNILTNKFLTNAPIQDTCLSYSYGLRASLDIASDSRINEYMNLQRNFKPSQSQMIGVLRSLYDIYVNANNGYLSTIFVGLSNGDYFALINCASSDNANIDACIAIPSTSTSKIVYQIINYNVTATQFLYSYQIDLTSPVNWNAFPAPMFKSTYSVDILSSVWYTYGASSATTISPYHNKYGSSASDAVRSFVNPIQLKDGTLIGVVGAQKPNNEPCWNICRRNSASGYITAAVKEAIANNKFNLDTNNLNEAISILSAMAKSYIYNAFHTTRLVYLGSLASKNSYGIRNCFNPFATSPHCKAAGPGVVAVAEISSSLIFGDTLRRAFIVTRFGDIINTTLSTVGPAYDPTTRPFFQHAQATLVPGTGPYIDSFGRVSNLNYLPLFDSQGKFYAAVNSDIGYEESCTPKSMQPINACTVLNGGCSINADCVQSPFDYAVNCMCKTGFTGDGYICNAASAAATNSNSTNNTDLSSNCSSNNNGSAGVIGLSVACGILFIALIFVVYKMKQSGNGNTSTSSVHMERI